MISDLCLFSICGMGRDKGMLWYIEQDVFLIVYCAIMCTQAWTFFSVACVRGCGIGPDPYSPFWTGGIAITCLSMLYFVSIWVCLLDSSGPDGWCGFQADVALPHSNTSVVSFSKILIAFYSLKFLSVLIFCLFFCV